MADLVSGTSGTQLPAGSLLGTQIFSWECFMGTDAEPKTFLCFEVDVARVANSIKEMEIIFDFTTHQSLMYTPEGTLLDRLANEICSLFHGSNGFGIGKLELAPEEPLTHYTPAEHYCGRKLKFVAKDFNLRPKSCV